MTQNQLLRCIKYHHLSHSITFVCDLPSKYLFACDMHLDTFKQYGIQSKCETSHQTDQFDAIWCNLTNLSAESFLHSN